MLWMRGGAPAQITHSSKVKRIITLIATNISSFSDLKVDRIANKFHSEIGTKRNILVE